MLAKIGFYIIKFFVYIISYCPIFLLEMINTFIAKTRMTFAHKEKKIIFDNINKCLNIPRGSKESKDFALKVFKNQAMPIFLTLRETYRPKSIQIKGSEDIKKTIESIEAMNIGGIFITAHLGSWEHIGLIMKNLRKDLFFLAKDSKNHSAKIFFKNFRNKMNVSILNTDSPTLLKDMLNTIKNKKWLGFVMDQKPRKRIGPIVDFMKQETAFVSGPAKLAKKLKVPIVPIFVVQKDKKCLEVLPTKAILPESFENKSIEELTQELASCIEKAIRQHPEQWSWNYKRWKWDKRNT